MWQVRRLMQTVWLNLIYLLLASSGTQAWCAETGPAGEVVSVEGIVFIRQDGKEIIGKLNPARPGDRIVAGDVVNTASNGRIKILMKDKSIVDLGPSALFKVDHYSPKSGKDREVDVSMMYGTMRTAVTQKIEGKGRFKVRTPTATMGVRGTEFIVKAEMRSLDDVKKLASPQSSNPGNSGTSAPGAPSNQAIAKTEITVIQGQVDVAKKEPAKTELSGRKLASPEKVVSLTAGMQLATKTGDMQLAKPVTLDIKTLTTMATVAKFQDNTFTKAVVIETNSNNGPGGNTSGNGPQALPSGSGGGGEITKAALAAVVAAPPSVPISVDSFHDIPGTFGANQALNPPLVNPIGALKKLHVIITQ